MSIGNDIYGGRIAYLLEKLNKIVNKSIRNNDKHSKELNKLTSRLLNYTKILIVVGFVTIFSTLYVFSEEQIIDMDSEFK